MDSQMDPGKATVPNQVGTSNQTLLVRFLLQGFSEYPDLWLPLFGCCSFFYTMALMGNILIIAIITCSPSLHSPMYFFLFNLAIMDIICSSAVLPKMLVGLALKENTSSFQGCMTQLFFIVLGVSSELLLLAVMACDRYMAICRPLHYRTLMTPWVCGALAIVVWVICVLNSSINTGLMTRLYFCGSNVITNFFCELPSLLLLSCSPTHVNSIMTILADAFYGLVNFILTLVSYGCIISSILRIRSSEGKRRAFSTCSSHLIVVSVSYSAVFCAYINLGSNYNPQRNKVAGLLYTMLSPALNPLIYTLRNKEVKAALGKVLLFCRN
ncbi:olfactory receptor 13A1-like [Dasypus novemcinctus]|uniref:olfactory receptor 13A1-like n=1 Tax=Dasypus novemcinctus TaxID=9361 RepID=UPI00265D9384|nr:olfactory receptor 13A1-like [Dasypus novemcinctus]